ncbi:DUF6597 domain-containing transcriptional factor [Cellulophaga fucicola]|uniref:DUF6597 domain-containing transcriptional factor n=1 Tax=Cellulophaga fucicola TaxID=76595 RepID=UPI003EB70D6A
MQKEALNYVSKRMLVPQDFKDIFSHFYFSQNNTKKPIVKTLLPNFNIIMVFSFGTPIFFKSDDDSTVCIEKFTVLGPIKKALEYTLSAKSEMLVVSFKDDAFYRFFGKEPFSNNLQLNLDASLNLNCFVNLWHLIKAENINKKISLILDFCKPYLKNRETAFNSFLDYKNDYSIFNPIKTIALDTQQSERTIQLKHKKYFGYSAKEKSRYLKFIKAIELLEKSNTKVNWFTIIDACGYYDQSQLIRDFNYFTNHSPKHYLKSINDVCNAKK